MASLMNDNVVALIAGLIDGLRNEGTIISETYDPVSGRLELEISDAFDLEKTKFVQINGINYKIKSFTAATGTDPAKIQIVTDGTLGETIYKTAYPYFFHGSFQQIDKQVSNITEQNEKVPLVLLIYNLSENDIWDETSVHSRIVKIRIAFLGESTTDDTTDAHQTVIDEQYDNYLKFKQLCKDNGFIDDNSIDTAKVESVTNFGQFITDRGEVSLLKNIQSSGVITEIDLPIFYHFDDCHIEGFEFFKCAPGLIKDDAGVLIQTLGPGETFFTGGATGYYFFGGDNDDVIEIASLPVNAAGTFNSNTLTNVDSVVYEVDTGSGFGVVTLPFSLATGNGFRITITRSTPTVDSVVQIDS